MYDFLSNGGKGKVKRSTIVGDIEVGGLKMVDDVQSFTCKKDSEI